MLVLCTKTRYTLRHFLISFYRVSFSALAPCIIKPLRIQIDGECMVNISSQVWKYYLFLMIVKVFMLNQFTSAYTFF